MVGPARAGSFLFMKFFTYLRRSTPPRRSRMVQKILTWTVCLGVLTLVAAGYAGHALASSHSGLKTIQLTNPTFPLTVKAGGTIPITVQIHGVTVAPNEIGRSNVANHVTTTSISTASRPTRTARWTYHTVGQVLMRRPGPPSTLTASPSRSRRESIYSSLRWPKTIMCSTGLPRPQSRSL